MCHSKFIQTLIVFGLFNHCLTALRPVSYWLTVELISFDFESGCLSSGGCGSPRLKISTARGELTEDRAVSWPVDRLKPKLIDGEGDEDPEPIARFVTHWTDGHVTDVGITAEMAGTDPVYGFSRVCDGSTIKQPFSTPSNGPQSTWQGETDPAVVAPPNGGISVENERPYVCRLSGKCFNLTLLVTPHLGRCPWCEQFVKDYYEQQQQQIGSESGVKVAGLQYFLEGEDSLLDRVAPVWLVVLLVVVTFLISTAFVVVLTAFIRQRRQYSWMGVGRSLAQRTASYHDKVHVDIVRRSDSSAESKYETPWDQKFRPLPYWLRSELSSNQLNSQASTATATITDNLHHHQQQQYQQPQQQHFNHQQQQQLQLMNGGGHNRALAQDNHYQCSTIRSSVHSPTPPMIVQTNGGLSPSYRLTDDSGLESV